MTPDKHDALESEADPGLDPRDNPGYAEEQPDSIRDAQKSGPPQKPDPEDGGMEREPDGDADTAQG